ncbi:hypothetical protein I7I50_12167 [Histoplasma capsulatum G186AR]|uniref:Uncharacterized protein n=1 Tax=Ajellomyces capsulatus TaxID=5037 RepID=A0A8H8CS45_AJECA|nr:hypothetical protein I7I52_11521 [Histoplasma capsulatum]QSS70512.1 hypothetical protein I7I50_12167 [Histoplasma capsulatum G186AR]
MHQWPTSLKTPESNIVEFQPISKIIQNGKPHINSEMCQSSKENFEPQQHKHCIPYTVYVYCALSTVQYIQPSKKDGKSICR